MKAKFIKPQMVRILNSLSIDTVKIPNKNYAIGKYPITIAEYIHFAKDTNSHYPEWYGKELDDYKKMNLSDNSPIIGVSWYDAVAYCEWLSKKTGKKYRLPLVEEEWVYAVTQDEEAIDTFGNKVSNADDYAWFSDNSGGTTHIVGEKQAYSLDIYDMYGNVREWAEESDDKKKAAVCGGSWNMSKYDWHFDEFEKSIKNTEFGFRIVLELDKQEEPVEILTLQDIVKKYYDDIYNKLLIDLKDLWTDYTLDPDNSPEGIDEVRIIEMDMPDNIKMIKLVKNHDTYLLTIEFESTAYVWMLIDKYYHDYMSLKSLPTRDHNKQYYSAESKEILFVTVSAEFNIDKNNRIANFLIDSIDDVVLEENEYGDEREEGIKEQIFNNLKETFKDLRLEELEYYQVHDSSLPSDDNSAIITSYDTSNTIEIEDIEIFSDKFSAKVYVEQKVYLDIHILKNEYYSNEEYISLYGAAEELNEHYVTVEGEALIRITLNIQGIRTNKKEFKDNFDVEIEDILIIEQIPMNEDIVSEKYTICQMLSTSYFIKIILSEKDKKKMSGGYVYIDIRDYGIDGYLKYPSKESTTSYDIERFKNILNNVEKKHWEIELNCSGMKPEESMGVTYLASKIFKYLSIKEKENYLNFLAIESEMEAWLSENYIEVKDELTYDAYEGKYQHIRGGTSDLEEVLYSKFKNIYSQEYVARAIKTINQAYGDKDFNKIIYSKEDDATPDISYFTKEYSHKIDDVVKWVFENYEDPISLTSDVLKEILVVEFKEKYSNDFIENIIESIKLEYGEVNNIDESDKGFLNIVKRNGKIETLDVTKIQNYMEDIDDMATREELHKKHKEWLAKKNKNLDVLRGKKDKKK